MERKEYSASAVKMSFWFVEFRKVVQLLDEGKNMDEVKHLALSENLFAAPTTLRATQIFRTVSGRIKTLDGCLSPHDVWAGQGSPGCAAKRCRIPDRNSSLFEDRGLPAEEHLDAACKV